MGLRGGGGNFGVVTRLDLRLHPVGPHVLAGPVAFELHRLRAVLEVLHELVAADHAWQSFSDAAWLPGRHNYWKSEYLARLDDDAAI